MMCVANPREGTQGADSDCQVRRYSSRKNSIVADIAVSECVHYFKDKPEYARQRASTVDASEMLNGTPISP